LASSKCTRARRCLAAALSGAGVVALPATAYAHAFGQQFVLPLPVSFYLYGAAAAVVVSFVVIACFTTDREAALKYGRYDVTDRALVNWVVHPVVLRLGQTIGAVTLLALILAGVVGHQVPGANLASVVVWIVAYLGLAYTCALIGDVWSVVGPFRAFARFAERPSRVRYPAWLGYLPAVAGLYIFIWLELLSSTAAGPRETTLGLVLYYAMCVVATAVFGAAAWFRFGDFLSVFFSLLGRLSIVERHDGRLYLRWPFVGALSHPAVHGSLALFILLMLSSTAFDGFRETTLWARAMAGLPGADREGVRLIVETVTLLVSPFVFFLAYAGAVALMKWITRTPLSIGALIGHFALSLLPIALVYHFAHYFTLLLIQGQAVFALASDPFGQGWDLFGTASMLANAGVIGAKTVWNVQLLSILAGHIASVYLAHRLALSLFPSSRAATRSQLPMLVLMVGYTVFGLWILAQPMNPTG